MSVALGECERNDDRISHAQASNTFADFCNVPDAFVTKDPRSLSAWVGTTIDVKVRAANSCFAESYDGIRSVDDAWYGNISDSDVVSIAFPEDSAHCGVNRPCDVRNMHDERCKVGMWCDCRRTHKALRMEKA